MTQLNWQDYYPEFQKHEFDCKHTGLNNMTKEFMDKLHALRLAYNKPMIISSGYRHESHPIEAEKSVRGEHTYGECCDIAVGYEDAYELLRLAFEHGFTRIGVKQHDEGRFIHLGMSDKFPNPRVWSY
jgi:hypothetical protein